MNIAPPFAPPYKTITVIDEGVSAVEIRADGTAHPVAAGPIISNHAVIASAASTPYRGMPAANNNGKAKLFLNVPFAEKDNVKRLGAKWDVATRKWYVPDGVKAEIFSRWQDTSK